MKTLLFLTLLALPGCSMLPTTLDRLGEQCLNSDGSLSYSSSSTLTKFECDRGTFGRP